MDNEDLFVRLNYARVVPVTQGQSNGKLCHGGDVYMCVYACVCVFDDTHLYLSGSLIRYERKAEAQTDLQASPSSIMKQFAVGLQTGTHTNLKLLHRLFGSIPFIDQPLVNLRWVIHSLSGNNGQTTLSE